MDGDRDAVHAFFIACSYGMTALAIIVEIVAARRRRRRAAQVAAALAEDDPRPEPPSFTSTAPSARGSHEIPA